MFNQQALLSNRCWVPLRERNPCRCAAVTLISFGVLAAILHVLQRVPDALPAPDSSDRYFPSELQKCTVPAPPNETLAFMQRGTL